jgi:hypothetical protein
MPLAGAGPLPHPASLPLAQATELALENGKMAAIERRIASRLNRGDPL